MGLGMDVDTNGHNIVFTGGTGILVFLDLVAKIVLQNCGANSSNSVIESMSPSKLIKLGSIDSNFNFSAQSPTPTM